MIKVILLSQIIQICNFFRYKNPIKFDLKFTTKIFILLLFNTCVIFAQSNLSERNKKIKISEITFSFEKLKPPSLERCSPPRLGIPSRPSFTPPFGREPDSRTEMISPNLVII